MNLTQIFKQQVDKNPLQFNIPETIPQILTRVSELNAELLSINEVNDDLKKRLREMLLELDALLDSEIVKVEASADLNLRLNLLKSKAIVKLFSLERY